MSGLLHISFAAYVALDGVNWSSLKEMRESPLHYIDAKRQSKKATPSQRAGSVIHSAILEPEKLATEYTVYTGDGTRASKEYKAFAADCGPSVTILKETEMDAAVAIKNAVCSHAVAGPLFRSGFAERSFQWTDPRTKLLCKGRTDWLAPDGRGGFTLVDLKSARSVAPRLFGQAAAKYGYHNQHAHYLAGLRAIGVKVSSCVIVAVEQARPYDVVVYVVGSDQLYPGEEENAALLARVAECEASGVWPGREPNERMLELPRYVYQDDEEENDTSNFDFGAAK